MHIRRIDLNLVAVFDAVIAEGNLSAAAKRLGMSQSAASHALARLRSVTGDELFVRTRYGMKPTVRALALAEPLRSALDLMQIAFSAKYGDDPSKPGRTFVVDFPVGFDVILVPPLLASAREFGVNAHFRVQSDRAIDLVSALRYGETELALDHVETKVRGMVCEPLYKDQFVVCARKAHPELAQGLTKDCYQRLGHVTLNWTRSRSGSPVDDRFTALGVERTVAVSMPTLAGCASVVAATNLVFTIHSRVASVLASRFDLQVFPVPLPIEPLTMFKIWHVRSRNDASHRWLRNTLGHIAERLSKLSAPEI